MTGRRLMRLIAALIGWTLVTAYTTLYLWAAFNGIWPA